MTKFQKSIRKRYPFKYGVFFTKNESVIHVNKDVSYDFPIRSKSMLKKKYTFWTWCLIKIYFQKSS